jgi:outer membrane protein OmpA-like peptidoglycan-associated protein
MLDPYLPQLQEAGRLLRADFRTRLTLRGYAAPSGTSSGQITRSAARIWACVEFLRKEYGISEERIRMAFYGAEGMTRAENDDWKLRRRVELIVEEPSQFRYEVFYEADSGSKIITGYLPLLQSAGRRMNTYPQTRLVVRGFAPPPDADEGQITVSSARIWSCVEYLKKEYNIPEERIRIAFSSVGGTTPAETFNLRRRVELFPEPIGAPEPEEPHLRPLSGINVGGDADNWAVSVQNKIFFGAESGTKILDPSLPLLRSAGRLLQADSRKRITLRGYAAPTGTIGGQLTRSAARVWSCAEYLKKEYGVSESRIRMAFYGAEGMSEAERADLNQRRRVDIIVEEPKLEKREYIVYFEAASGTRMLARSIPLLRAAGARLREFPQTHITLRGYAAPSGSEEGQTAISAARAWYCAEYLMREFNIPERRIRLAFFGADETPITGTSDMNRYRRVEMTVEQD